MSVGVVGGGVTGLALHHYLRESGVESTVFEADDQPGGVIRSRRVEGRVLDLGPQRTRLTPAIADLVESLGLDDELRTADDDLPLYVYRDGRLRLVPTSARAALRTDLLSWRGKARTLLEPLTGPPRAGESVEEFLTRTLGTEVARYLGGPLYAGIYGSRPDEMPVEHSLAKALDEAGVEGSLLVAAARKLVRGRDAPPIASFDGGLQRLPEALAEAHADSVRLGTPVRDVRREGMGVGEGGCEGEGGGGSEDEHGTGQFAVETPGGTERVDRLVVTTPAPVTADLLADLPGFAPDAAGALRELTYNPQVVVHLHAEADLTGAGYQVQYEEDFRTLGVTWNASLLGRDGVYTCYVGGSRNPGMVEWDDDRLASVAREEFDEVTGHAARPLAVHRLEPGMPAYDHSWAALDRVSVPAGVRLATNYTARAGIPGRVREAKRVAGELAAELREESAATASPRPS